MDKLGENIKILNLLEINQNLVNKIKNILYNLKHQPQIIIIDNLIELMYEIDKRYLFFIIYLDKISCFYHVSTNYNETGIHGKMSLYEINEDDLYNIIECFHTKPEDEFIKYLEK